MVFLIGRWLSGMIGAGASPGTDMIEDWIWFEESKYQDVQFRSMRAKSRYRESE
jgi:hypothetical protein